MTGDDAVRLVDALVRRGWTRPEIAAALSLRSTDTFRKWGEKHAPRLQTAKALRGLRRRDPPRRKA